MRWFARGLRARARRGRGRREERGTVVKLNFGYRAIGVAGGGSEVEKFRTENEPRSGGWTAGFGRRTGGKRLPPEEKRDRGQEQAVAQKIAEIGGVAYRGPAGSVKQVSGQGN